MRAGVSVLSACFLDVQQLPRLHSSNQYNDMHRNEGMFCSNVNGLHQPPVLFQVSLRLHKTYLLELSAGKQTGYTRVGLPAFRPESPYEKAQYICYNM